jgi:hypothetical protein
MSAGSAAHAVVVDVHEEDSATLRHRVGEAARMRGSDSVTSGSTGSRLLCKDQQARRGRLVTGSQGRCRACRRPA